MELAQQPHLFMGQAKPKDVLPGLPGLAEQLIAERPEMEASKLQ
jgi:hypothetical protein